MDEPFEPTPESARHSLGSFLLGMGAGALIGAVAAMLLAPQSGTETREDLSQLPGKVKERADEMIAELKENLEDLSAKSRELVESTRDRVEAAIQAGREAADEKRQELESQLREETTPPPPAEEAV